MEQKEAKSSKASIGAKSRWSKRDSILDSTGEMRTEIPQVYIIICEGNGERFVKVGITSSYISRRYSGKMPYEISTYKQFFSYEYIDIESELNSALSKFRYEPMLDFPGKLECYSIDCLDNIDSFKSSFKIEKTYVANESHVRCNAIKESKEKEKKENKPPLIPPKGEIVSEVLITKKKRKLSGKRLETFNTFWEKFNYRKGKAEAADSWIDIPELTISLCDRIYLAADAEAKRRPELESSGKTPKMAQGWISSRRWEDEIYDKNQINQPEKKQSQRCER